MPIDKTELLVKAQELRKNLGEDNESPMDIFSLALSIEKLTLIKYPMGAHLSGMCIKSNNGNVIAINSTMTLGRQCFSLAHELYHLYFDDNMTAICAAPIGSGNNTEKKADQFASFFLIPPVSLRRKIKELKANEPNRNLSVSDVVQLEQYYRVSRQAMLIRLIADGEMDAASAESMRQGVRNSAKNLGYNTDLYQPTEDEKQYATYGYFIKQANEAYKKGLISEGKFEEFLLHAFRADIVYGDEEGGEVVD